MKVLLVWPKARTDPDWGGDLGAIAEPLALEYLAAAIAEEGHQARILDLRLHPLGLETTLFEFQPDIIGVTAFSMHVGAGLGILQTAKKLLPDILSIAGGHHATLHPEDFFEPQVDLIVEGEGVGPLRELLRKVAAGQSLRGVPGVYYQTAAGLFEQDQKPLAFMVDDLPRPDRKITQADRQSYFIDWMMPVALLRTSVGCPYRCTFCSLWKISASKYHKRAIEAVLEEVKTIEEEFIFLIDDEAFIDSKRMLDMALLFKEHQVYKRFFAYARIDTILRSREVLSAWRAVGLERLFVGIDAFTEKDLKEYNKKLTVDQIEQGLELAKELDIEIFAQFVVNTDYTEKDFKQLVRFIEHLKIDYPTFTILTPLPGTSLLNADFSNVTMKQPNGRPDWDYFDTQSIVLPTKLPPAEFRKQYRGLFRIFNNRYSQFLIHKPRVRQ